MLDFAVPFAIGLLSESDLIVPVVLPFCPAVWDLLLYSGLCPKRLLSLQPGRAAPAMEPGVG